MEKVELPTKRRIEQIYREDNLFNKDDLRKVYYAFEKLLVLKKNPIPERMKGKEEVFYRDKELFQERMKWINEFMRSKGYNEDLFRNIESFKISSDDYDYYYELKTPTQLKEEEEARKKEEKQIEK